MMGHSFNKYLLIFVIYIPAPVLSPENKETRDAVPTLNKLTVNYSENHSAMC